MVFRTQPPAGLWSRCSVSAPSGQFAEQSNVGPHTLDQFRADLARIATTYPNRPVYPVFVELRELRNRAFELLEGRQYPEQSRELYLVAGVLCGMLAFPLAKQSYCAATARLWLGGQDSYIYAERDAAHAIELYEADPPEQRRLGELCLAQLDLVAARLGRDDLDGAAEQLQGVLAIAAQRRIESVSRRLHQVGRGLQRPKYQTCALALDLHDQIRSFSRTSAPPVLPGASG